MDEQQIINDYKNNKSTCEIAKTYNTYPNKILRVLSKHGVPIRNKSEAQKTAIKTGRIKPPMIGKKQRRSTKEKISESRSAAWRKSSPEKLEEFKKSAKERWNKKSPEERYEFHRKAGQEMQRASKEGSAAEKFLYTKLQKHGYDTIMHKTGIGGEFEVDLFVQELNTAIEIDGPQHYLPVFGDKVLQKNIRNDSIKNGLLISKGFFIVRVKYLAKKISMSVKRRLWNAISQVLKDIESGKCSNKLIEIEVD
jgi:very-short-patch-repair endonuclease